MPPIVCGLLPVVLILVALCFPAATAQTLPAADMEVMRSALAAAQSGDWSRAYAGAATITDPLPVKMLRWMDYARPGAPGRFPDIAEFIEKNPDWPGQKALRKHAEEALAGESDAVAAEWFKRYPPVSPTGKVREAEMMMNSGDLDGGIAALRALWITADFGPLDEKNFLARHSASLRPEDHAQRIDRLLWDGQSEAAHRMLGLVPSDYRPVAEARLALAAQAANAEALVGAGSGAAALGSGARLRAAALAPQKGHDRCRGPNSARPAQRPRPPGGVVGGTASDCPTRSRRRQRRTCLSHRRAAWPDRRKRVLRSPVPLGLYCAALHEAAGAGLRTLLAHPDAGRHTLRQGASRLLGGTGRRRARQIRPRGQMVRRRGRSHGHLLRAARRASARARCAAAAGARAGTRCCGAGPVRR